MFFLGGLQAGIGEALQASSPLGLADTDFDSNGQLVTHLRAGIEFEEFANSVFETLSRDVDQTSGDRSSKSAVQLDGSNERQSETLSGAHVQHIPNPRYQRRQSGPAAAPSNTLDSRPPTVESSPLQDRDTSSSSSTMQQVMEDRRLRLEADKAKKDAAEAEKRKAVVQARREAAGTASGTATSKKSQYAQEQRKRKQEAKAEKERILLEIENNKAERKEREAQRRALAKAEAAEALDPGSAEGSVDQNVPKNWASDTELQSCSLQIRLFDGSTIRGRFASGQTVSKDIRTWIASQRTDGDTPFTLKQILSPLPNRTITISEEEESLQSLGFLPSATLVMVPIQGYTGAYNSGLGVMSRAMSVGYDAASAGGNMLKGVLGTFLGFGRAASSDQEPVTEEQQPNSTSAVNPRTTNNAEGIKFRTLRGQGEGDNDHQLYNGNQV
ncbi:MAG: hypothetical protein Q9218_003987 [Villophora microphyllina]